MTPRERVAMKARRLLGDERVVAFLQITGGTPIPVWDVWRADDRLRPGQPLDDMFYTGSEYGFVLLTEQFEEVYQLGFGYQQFPSAGWGKIWHVTFRGDEIASSRRVGQWYDSWGW